MRFGLKIFCGFCTRGHALTINGKQVTSDSNRGITKTSFWSNATKIAKKMLTIILSQPLFLSCFKWKDYSLLRCSAASLSKTSEAELVGVGRRWAVKKDCFPSMTVRGTILNTQKKTLHQVDISGALPCGKEEPSSN